MGGQRSSSSWRQAGRGLLTGLLTVLVSRASAAAATHNIVCVCVSKHHTKPCWIPFHHQLVFKKPLASQRLQYNGSRPPLVPSPALTTTSHVPLCPCAAHCSCIGCINPSITIVIRGPDLGLGPEKVRREIQLQARLDHVNIVELKQVCVVCVR